MGYILVVPVVVVGGGGVAARHWPSREKVSSRRDGSWPFSPTKGATRKKEIARKHSYVDEEETKVI